jgi:hypothetical protein
MKIVIKIKIKNKLVLLVLSMIFYKNLQKEAEARLAQVPPRSGGTFPVVFHSSSTSAATRQVPARESRKLEEQQARTKFRICAFKGSEPLKLECKTIIKIISTATTQLLIF